MKKIFLALLALFTGAACFAQSADFVTEFLETPEATVGQVCYLTAVYQNLVPETASVEDAVKAMAEKKLVSENANPSEKISFENAAALFASIWKIRGGLMFTITKKSPRYAFKQLRNDKVIPSKTDPSQIPSGVDVLNMFTAGNIAYGE